MTEKIMLLWRVLKNDEIVILHDFIKKTEKTPSKELEIARR